MSIPDKNKAGSSKKAGAATEDCPLRKRITVIFRRGERKKKYPWWPKEDSPGYAKEGFSMDLTNGPQTGNLNSQGSIVFDDIPPGSCTFKSPDFHKDIEDRSRKIIEEYNAKRK